MKAPSWIARAVHGLSGAPVLLLIFAGMLRNLPPAHAIPAFARKYGLPCSACHVGWPMLNNFGLVFKDNGYQLGNDRDSPITRDASYFPMAVPLQTRAKKVLELSMHGENLPTAYRDRATDRW
jgi:hypothetical protein